MWPSDERDAFWQQPSNVQSYRVYAFTETAPGSLASQTWDFVETDVVEVLRWALRNVPSEALFSIALLVDDPSDGRGLCWLVGGDITDDGAPGRDRMRQVRTVPGF